jgi:hypothetical protein
MAFHCRTLHGNFWKAVIIMQANRRPYMIGIIEDYLRTCEIRHRNLPTFKNIFNPSLKRTCSC